MAEGAAGGGGASGPAVAPERTGVLGQRLRHQAGPHGRPGRPAQVGDPASNGGVGGGEGGAAAGGGRVANCLAGAVTAEGCITCVHVLHWRECQIHVIDRDRC